MAFKRFAVEEEAKGAAKSAGKGKQLGATEEEQDGTKGAKGSRKKGSKGRGKGRGRGKGKNTEAAEEEDDEAMIGSSEQPGASDGGKK